MVGKGENTGLQAVFLLPICFKSCLFWDGKKSRFCGKELTLSQTSPGFHVSAV